MIRSATAAMRGLLSLLALAAALALGSCTTVGPDFVRPQVPWLRDWSGGEWRALADAAPPRAPVPYDEWWRTFGDPVLDCLVAEAQRLNPGVQDRRPAHPGSARPTRHCRQRTVSAAATGDGPGTDLGNRDTDGRGQSFWSAGVGFELAWELDFWGKFKRGIESADAAYFASIAQYDDVQVLVAAQAASFYAAIRVFERRLAIARRERCAPAAQPRDHRAAVPQRE